MINKKRAITLNYTLYYTSLSNDFFTTKNKTA
jgi:hypothetical protein